MKRKILIYFILALIILSSCGKEEEKPKAENDKEKVSEELGKIQENSKSLIEDIEAIMEKTEEPIFVETKEEEEKKKSEEPEGQEGGESEGQQGGGQEGGEESQGQEQPSQTGEEKSYEEKKQQESVKRQEEIEKMWMELEPKISGIHTSWNIYKVTAIEEGANTKSIEATDEALNNLTINLGKKELIGSLKEGNKVIFSLANFFDIYKGSIEGNSNRLVYTANETYIQALENNWEKAQTVAGEYEEYFSVLRQKIELEEKDQKHLDKLEASMKDLIDSIQYQDANLVKIKRDIILENIEKVNEVAK